MGVEYKTTKQKRDSHIVEISTELMEILELIKKTVEDFTWGAENKLSNYAASKILARKVKEKKLY